MSSAGQTVMVLQTLCELARYDIVRRVFGDPSVQRHLRRRPCHRGALDAARQGAILAAFGLALCLYWKPVKCLQRSVVLARVLRRHGCPARVVIGYRPQPFVSHAWVEVDGHIVGESAAYPRLLKALVVA